MVHLGIKLVRLKALKLSLHDILDEKEQVLMKKNPLRQGITRLYEGEPV